MKKAKKKPHGNAIVLTPAQIELLKERTTIGCTITEIAAKLQVSHDYLQMRYADYFEEARADRNAMIRSWQMREAKNGSVPMLIWLGKTCLGQKDEAVIDLAKANKSNLTKEQQEEVLSFMKKAEKFLDDNQ